MMNKPPLIVIGGATACGKTSLSVALAKKINAQIISADSMQLYKGMDIGTAKATGQEMRGVRHYLIDEVEPDFDFSVFEFKKRACGYINEIYENGSVPILAGGTGFYIQAVLYDIDFSDEAESGGYRLSLEQMDTPALYSMLEETDSASAAAIHPNNKKRIIRALEFHHNTGKPISSHNEEQRCRKSPYNYAYFVLNRKRSVIYERIEQRTDLMLEGGLVQEVQSLLERGISEKAPSMQAIGYREIISYLKGEITLEQARDLIKLNTRHYAKRQITWFKREKDAVWLNFEDFSGEEEMLEEMINILKEKNIVQIS